MDLTPEAAQATRRARLVEQVLLDRVAASAIEERKTSDPKGHPPAVVVWVKDMPSPSLIADRPVSGRLGELHLLDAGAAEVLKDAGYVEVREPLTLPAAQRPDVAAELHVIAGELFAAAAALLPSAKPQAPAEQQDV